MALAAYTAESAIKFTCRFMHKNPNKLIDSVVAVGRFPLTTHTILDRAPHSRSPNKKSQSCFLCYETDEYWSHFHFSFQFNNLFGLKTYRLLFDRHHRRRHSIRNNFLIASLLIAWNPLTQMLSSAGWTIQAIEVKWMKWNKMRTDFSENDSIREWKQYERC